MIPHQYLSQASSGGSPELPQPVSVGIVHGAWHRGSHNDLLVRALNERGYRAFSPDLPSDDPEGSFEGDADTLVAAIEQQPGMVYLVGHSRGGEATALVTKRPHILRKIAGISIVNSGGPHRISNEVPYQDGSARYWPRFLQGIVQINERLTGFSRELAPEIFYPLAPEDVARKATQLLRPQHIPRDSETAAVSIPADIPLVFARSQECRVHIPEEAAKRLKVWAGPDRPFTIEEIEGDHTPQLSIPDKFAGYIDRWIREALAVLPQKSLPTNKRLSAYQGQESVNGHL